MEGWAEGRSHPCFVRCQESLDKHILGNPTLSQLSEIHETWECGKKGGYLLTPSANTLYALNFASGATPENLQIVNDRSAFIL